MRLILASTSPRRRDLLSLLHLSFEVAAPALVETIQPGVQARDQARAFAEGKASSCSERFPDSLVIGCDTLIEIEDTILGKSADAAEAVGMLRRLSGREHLIHSGVAVWATPTATCRSGVETVRVRFKPLAAEEIDHYVAGGEWHGKAGAYAIQGHGGKFIERIEGDFTAAVGLPLRLLSELLATFSCPVSVDDVYRQRPYPNWRRFG